MTHESSEHLGTNPVDIPVGDHGPQVVQLPAGRVLLFDSVMYVVEYADACPSAAGDVIVNGSYSGVLCARMAMRAKPRAVIGLDCTSKDGTGIAGLWYYDALDVPGAAVDVMSAEMGNAIDVYERGKISRVNMSAERSGIVPGMAVGEAVELMMTGEARPLQFDATHRTVIHTDLHTGRRIVCTDSIYQALPEDKDRSVLCVSGHAGRSNVDYFRKFRAWAFICSDGGVGRDNSGIAALEGIEPDGIPVCTVSAVSARMGDGLSTYYDGIISAANKHARNKGVVIGQSAREAALLLLE